MSCNVVGNLSEGCSGRRGGNMCYLARYARAFFIASLLSSAVAGCAVQKNQSQSAAPSAKQLVAAKPAGAAAATAPAKRVSKTAQPPAADSLATASASPLAAPAPSQVQGPADALIGRSWNYHYAGSRGLITYHSDGTFTYDEPGLRKGKGSWQARGDKLCHSFSGIKEPCMPLRQSGSSYRIGAMKLSLVAP